VSSTETRHPTVVASAANTLAELAPGRVILGLGTGAGLGQLIQMPATTRSVFRRDIEMVCTAFFSVTDDLERDAARFKPVCCLLAKAGAGQRVLAEANIDVGDLSSLPPLFPTIAHAENWDEAVRLASRVISDDAALLFAEKFGLFGTVEEIGARVAAIASTGVDHLFIRPMEPYQLPLDAIEAFAAALAKGRVQNRSTRNG
jgi:5,10-methylenetetrahydromethanopterin reductase